MFKIGICTLVVRPVGSDNCVCIYDDKGRVYYRRENCTKTKVNFPKAGIYYFKGCKPIEEHEIQINRAFFDLPRPERNRKIKTPVISKNNSFNGPARINTHKGVIEIGPLFFTLPVPSRLFILLHEIGHLYYTTESYCDMFAYYHFCKLGYNNSQAFFSLSKILTLHDDNLKRLENLLNIIKENEKTKH